MQSGKKSLCDIVNVLAAEGRVVRQCDQAIRNRFSYWTAAPVSESPASNFHLPELFAWLSQFTSTSARAKARYNGLERVD